MKRFLTILVTGILVCNIALAVTIKKKSSSAKFAKEKTDCATMGFKPNTDNFANCVLKLVEMDAQKKSDLRRELENKRSQLVLQQNNTANNTSSAEYNKMIAEQLEKNRDLQVSQDLINLGMSLLTPPKRTTPILPKTQRCYMRAYGMECY